MRSRRCRHLCNVAESPERVATARTVGSRGVELRLRICIPCSDAVCDQTCWPPKSEALGPPRRYRANDPTNRGRIETVMDRNRHAWIAGVLIGVLACAFAFAGCSSGPSATRTSAHGGTRPRCTLSAISKAAKSTPSIGPVKRVTGYGCAGEWAYAEVVVGAEDSFDAVIVLKVRGSGWMVSDRAKACLNRLVPASIYGPACTTS